MNDTSTSRSWQLTSTDAVACIAGHGRSDVNSPKRGSRRRAASRSWRRPVGARRCVRVASPSKPPATPTIPPTSIARPIRVAGERPEQSPSSRPNLTRGPDPPPAVLSARWRIRGGLDLGGTKIQAVVVDDANEVLGDARRPTPRKGGPEAVAAELADTLADACAGAGIDPGTLKGVGVGSPGAIDAEAGTVAQARNLPNWIEPFPLADRLSDAVGAPVEVDNDVTVATAAEFELGVGREHDSLLGVFWGTGVGGGIVLDGKLWSGRGAAGEIGHIVVKMDGRKCPCGRHGCMEAYAGRGAMEARARKLHDSGKGRKTELFKIMEKRGRERLTSGIWARALDAATSSRTRSSTRRSTRSATASRRRSTCSTSRRS